MRYSFILIANYLLKAIRNFQNISLNVKSVPQG